MAPYNGKEHQPPHPRLTLGSYDNRAQIRAQALLAQNFAAPAHQMAQAPTFTSAAQVPAFTPPAQGQFMTPFGATSSQPGNLGMLPPGQNSGFNPNGYGANRGPCMNNNPFQGHYAPYAYQQMYHNHASNNLVGWYNGHPGAGQARVPQNFHRFQAANCNPGWAFTGFNNNNYIAANNSPFVASNSSAFIAPNGRIYPQAPANVLGQTSTPNNVVTTPPLLASRDPSTGAYRHSPTDIFGRASTPGNVFPPPPQPVSHGYSADNVAAVPGPSSQGYGMNDALLEDYTTNNASFRSNAAFAGPNGAFAGPNGALSRGFNASFDTSVFDVGPQDFMQGVSFDSSNYDNDDDNIDDDKVPDAAKTLAAADDDDKTESFDWGSEKSHDGHNDDGQNNDLALTFASLPPPRGPCSPPGAYPLPSAQEIKKASRHRAWTGREKAAAVHGVLWGMVALADVDFDDRWERISQHLATHYRVLRPLHAVRQRWERYINDEYTTGVHLVKGAAFLKSVQDEYVDALQDCAEQKGGQSQSQSRSQRSFSNAGPAAAAGDKRKRVEESFDDAETNPDADGDDDPDFPPPSTPAAGVAEHTAKPHTPQTFPAAKKPKRAATRINPQLFFSSSLTSNSGGNGNGKHDKAAAAWTKTFPARRITSSAAGKKRAVDSAECQDSSPTATRGGDYSFPSQASNSNSNSTGGGGSFRNSFSSSRTAKRQRQRRAARTPTATGGGGAVSMNARLLVVGQKVLDTFAAQTGGTPLPADAARILRAAVEEFAPYARAAPGTAGGAECTDGVANAAAGKAGGRGGAEASFEVLDVEEEEEGDPDELRRMLEKGCIGKGVSFLYQGTEEVACAA